MIFRYLFSGKSRTVTSALTETSIKYMELLQVNLMEIGTVK